MQLLFWDEWRHVESHPPSHSYVSLIHSIGPRDPSSFKRAIQENFTLRSAEHWGPNSPLLRLEPRRWVPGDEEEGSHGVHVTESCKRPKQGPALVRRPKPGQVYPAVQWMLPSDPLVSPKPSAAWGRGSKSFRLASTYKSWCLIKRTTLDTTPFTYMD